MARCIKFKGYIKLHRTTIKKEQELNDAEIRLFYIYILIADWDKKHRDTFGGSNTTIRNIKEYYLPYWSIGKISYTRASLIKKGYLEKQSKRIYVTDYYIYRDNVQRIEQEAQSTEQSFQSLEYNAQQAEKNTKGKTNTSLLKNGLYSNGNKEIVQQNKQSHSSKENLKKFKKELNKVDKDFFKKVKSHREWRYYVNNIRLQFLLNRSLNIKEFPPPIYNKLKNNDKKLKTIIDNTKRCFQDIFQG